MTHESKTNDDFAGVKSVRYPFLAPNARSIVDLQRKRGLMKIAQKLSMPPYSAFATMCLLMLAPWPALAQFNGNANDNANSNPPPYSQNQNSDSYSGADSSMNPQTQPYQFGQPSPFNQGNSGNQRYQSGYGQGDGGYQQGGGAYQQGGNGYWQGDCAYGQQNCGYQGRQRRSNASVNDVPIPKSPLSR